MDPLTGHERIRSLSQLELDMPQLNRTDRLLGADLGARDAEPKQRAPGELLDDVGGAAAAQGDRREGAASRPREVDRVMNRQLDGLVHTEP